MTLMPYLAIMQGRLVPPEGGHVRFFPNERWRDEFPLARSAGLDGIEWIYDLYGERVNPLAIDSGIAEMCSLSAQTGVNVRSLCANYFMDRPFLRAATMESEAWVLRMEWLLSRCNAVGIKRITIPLLDESAIETEKDKLHTVSMMRAFLPAAEKFNISLDLETSLAPQDVASLVKECSHPLIRVAFDSGNSASLGYDPIEEFAAYGNLIGTVHIKDRRRGAGTVPLGTGNADLPAVFRGLAALPYRGDYVMEIARSEPGQELQWITQNRAWIASRIEAAVGVAQ
jgi:L-ribulose-5-phosphate 3-epimerase